MRSTMNSRAEAVKKPRHGVDNCGEAGLFLRVRALRNRLEYGGMGVAHRDSPACPKQHRQVVRPAANGQDPIASDTDTPA